MDWARDRPRAAIGIGASAVVCVVVMVLALAHSTSPRLARRVPMIDVQTAQVFWMPTGSRAVSVPAAHPKTGEHTLVGVDRESDGSWRVLPQDLPLVPTLGVRVSRRIDASTGIVAGEIE